MTDFSHMSDEQWLAIAELCSETYDPDSEHPPYGVAPPPTVGASLRIVFYDKGTVANGVVVQADGTRRWARAHRG